MSIFFPRSDLIESHQSCLMMVRRVRELARWGVIDEAYAHRQAIRYLTCAAVYRRAIIFADYGRVRAMERGAAR